MALNRGEESSDIHACARDLLLNLINNEVLKQKRTLDDKVVYSLNTSILTDSFSKNQDATEQCKSLFQQLSAGHSSREKAIKVCIQELQGSVEELRGKRQANMEDLSIMQKLRKEQTTLRFMQSELLVEEVIKERSFKVFNERCRHYYNPEKPPS